MSLEIKRKFQTTSWSGGDSTELYIFPQESAYAQRDFQFRLSVASIATQKSVFTKLPGFQRKLMLLEGQLQLKHKDHHQKNLNVYEQDQFDGDWQTESNGLGKDFNLMYHPAMDGRINHLSIGMNGEHTMPMGNSDLQFLYLHKGKIVLQNSGELKLLQGELLCFTNESLHLKAEISSELIHVAIKL